MPWHLVTRALFVAAVAWAAALTRAFHPGLPINLGVGVALGILIVYIETRLRSTEVTDLLGALIGGAIGLGLSKTIGAALFWANASDRRVVFLHSFILLVFPYLGIVMGARKGEWLKPQRLVGLFRDTGPQKRYRILDTSVIIDGRIADVCETGFLDGTLVIPQFVLKELQLVADSADSLKRNRGRRGLDILQKIQKMAGVDVTISDIDFPDVREVDLKLIELGRSLQGKIVTNDFNLNKVAQLRGVDVLNVNELANSLKPVVLPGEIMTSTPDIFWIFCRMSRPRRPRLRLSESAESATSCSSFKTNCGMTSVPSRKPVSQTSAIRPSMMTLVSRMR